MRRRNQPRLKNRELGMKREYDFSKAERGNFYRKGAELRLPIYLDPKLQARVERLAQKNGKEDLRGGESACAKGNGVD
ncbi:MAG TPA: hypothetical protein VEW46_06780 [Pyrinomonadaceae bacterium]|nr:hypothetical protein [Pyrinomonadaceae bacterium]